LVIYSLTIFAVSLRQRRGARLQLRKCSISFRTAPLPRVDRASHV